MGRDRTEAVLILALIACLLAQAVLTIWILFR